MLEKREYNNDCSEKDIQLLKNQVEVLKDNIILFHEAPVMSDFQINTMWEKVDDLIIDSSDYYLLVDLVNTKPPNAPQRLQLKGYFTKHSKSIKHTALYTGKNKLLNFVAKFVLGAVINNKFSIHNSKEEALIAIYNAKNK
jgi:hypothetical protein